MASRRARREASREDILEAARSLLLERGHDKLSLREVARRASFSPAGLYEYFDGKDALVNAVAERIERQLRRRLQAVADEATEGQDRLVKILMAYIAYARDNPEDFQLLYARLSQPRRSLEDPIPEGSPWAVLLAAVSQAHEEGALTIHPDVPHEAIAYGLWALANGAAMLQLTYLKEFDAPFPLVDEMHIASLIRSYATLDDAS
jgi:AcrR family transcriptional regulator